MDDLIILKYMILIELILLLITGLLGGRNGLIITTILSIALFSGFLFVTSGLSGAYTNIDIEPHLNRSHINQIVIISITFIYLALGVYKIVEYIKFNRTVSKFILLWLFSVIGVVIGISVIQYFNNPLRIENEKIERRVLERREFNNYLTELENTFLLALRNKEFVDDYIILSESVTNMFSDNNNLSTLFANYTTKLMIEYIFSRDLYISLKLFNSYIYNIIPKVGLSDKSLDVASIGVVLSKELKDLTVYYRVVEYILGSNFNIEEISNPVLLYNLACNYSIQRDKKNLIIATSQALKYGKRPKQFLEDADFKNFIDDKDFLLELNRESIDE